MDNKIAGGIFLLMILIMLYPTLNSQVHDISDAVGATSYEIMLGTIFPITWIFVICLMGGIVAFYAIKQGMT